MKVAIVVYGSLSNLSGGYLYDRMLVSKMRQRGDDVEVISLHDRGYAANLLDNFRASAYLDVDVLIQDELNHASLFLSNRRRPRPPIVSIVHHLRSSEHRARWQNALYATVEKEYLLSVDGFIFNSKATRDTVLTLMRREPAHVVATPGGDRFGAATPEQVRARIAAGSTLRVLSVGSVIPAKGLDVLLTSLQGLEPEGVTLDVVGSEQAAPAFAREMHAKAASLKLPVTFHGALSDDELHALLQRADVFVLPSYYEGFGIVYLEAMAQGIPAIGVKAGGAPALIQDGGNGYLIAPGDAATLTERLRGLARDRALLTHMSLKALSSAAKFPTWDQSTDKMRDFLASISRQR